MSVNNNRKCAKCGRTRAEDMSVTYHRFPNPGKDNITKAHAWAKYCWPNGDWSSREPLYSLHITNKVLCGRHFHSSQFYDNERKKLSKFAVPELTEIPNDKTNVFNEISLDRTSAMPKCSVISCSNNTRHVRKKDGVSYFSFPRNPIRCSEWAVIIGKARNEFNYKPNKGSVVCSNHFPASDIYTTTKGFSRLNKNAKPILHLSKIQNSDQDSNQQTIKQNDVKTESSFDENSSREIKPSPSTSMSIESILETPREMFIKKKLNSCEKIIQNKNRLINRLRKQNKRLIKNNTILKNALCLLKSRKGVEEMYRKNKKILVKGNVTID